MIVHAEKTKNEIVKHFAQAVRDKDTAIISSLLSEVGVFTAQDGENTTIQVGKDMFIQWLKSRLNEAVISKVDYDYCIHCRMGNPVILFNEGTFPRNIKDDSEKSMTGLMLEVGEGLISGISFCYSFAHRENNYQFERYGPMVDELVSRGIPLREACKMVEKENRATQSLDE